MAKSMFASILFSIVSAEDIGSLTNNSRALLSQRIGVSSSSCSDHACYDCSNMGSEKQKSAGTADGATDCYKKNCGGKDIAVYTKADKKCYCVKGCKDAKLLKGLDNCKKNQICGIKSSDLIAMEDIVLSPPVEDSEMKGSRALLSPRMSVSSSSCHDKMCYACTNGYGKQKDAGSADGATDCYKKNCGSKNIAVYVKSSKQCICVKDCENPYLIKDGRKDCNQNQICGKIGKSDLESDLASRETEESEHSISSDLAGTVVAGGDASRALLSSRIHSPSLSSGHKCYSDVCAVCDSSSSPKYHKASGKEDCLDKCSGSEIGIYCTKKGGCAMKSGENCYCTKCEPFRLSDKGTCPDARICTKSKSELVV